MQIFRYVTKGTFDAYSYQTLENKQKFISQSMTSKTPARKGDDGYKTFSIRIKEETVNKLDALSEQTNRSRNELINLILEYGVENAEIIE